MVKENKKLSEVPYKGDKSSPSQTPKKIVIIGLPNTGKSHVFNLLTGEYSIVANYPLTTVEIKKAPVTINGQPYRIFDTPGLHSLYIHSEEEVVVRDMLFSEKPDILLQCIDANRVKQSLTLTVSIMELGIPMAIVLNAVDETAQKGITVNAKTMSLIFGIPVVQLHNLEDRGTKKMKRALQRAQVIQINADYGSELEEGLKAIASLVPESIPYQRKVAVLLLESDKTIVDTIRKSGCRESLDALQKKVAIFQSRYTANIGRAIKRRHNRWVDTVYEGVVAQRKAKENKILETFAQLSRHPVFGVPILAFFLLITYLLVVYVAGFMNTVLSAATLDPVVNSISQIIPSGFWHEFLVGHYGILTLGFFNAIVTILPILSVFFLIFAFLEDIGYMPNLCVLTKRIFEKIGLTGNAIMPLILGFGCKTMATLVTKSLTSKKEKFIAVYLIAFAIPCSAQLGINMGILGNVGISAFIIAFSVMVFLEMVAGLALNKIIKDDAGKKCFIQELPPIRLPSLKAIVVKTYYRLYWFLKEALPVFIIAAVLIFFADKAGVLNALKNFLSPIVINWLGLPVDIVDVLILCVARREAAAGLLINMVDAGLFNYIQCIVAVVITTISFPCFANISVISKEMGIKTTIIMVCAIMVSSLLFGGILNWVLVFTLGR